MTTSEQRFEQAFNALGKHFTMDRFPLLLDIANSKGNVMRTVRGAELIDCYTAFASLPLGWNHPKLDNDEFRAKLGRVAVNKPALSDTFTEHVASFVETFYRVAVPEQMKWLFLIDGGALAVENALKAAIDWKVRKNLAAGKGEKGKKILHFEKCFHGRSGYTMSLTDSPDPRKTLYFPQFDWPRVPAPAVQYPLTDETLPDLVQREAASVAAIEAAFDAAPDEIAAIIIETIQGEGGDNHFRPEFFAELKRISLERDALLILDEVQAGVGLSGTMWAWQQMGIEPDICVFGKKAQVCGLFAGPRLDEVERNVFVEPSRINSTFGGNLVDIVRFQRILEVIEEDDLLSNVRDVGTYFLSELNKLQDRYPALLSNARGRGLFLAFDLPDTETRDAIMSETVEAGLMGLSSGYTTMRFRPGLTFSRQDVDAAVAVLDQVLAARS